MIHLDKTTLFLKSFRKRYGVWKIFSSLCLWLLAGVLIPESVSAQMFSGDEKENRSTASQNRGLAFSAGVQFTDFTYRGGNESDGELRFDSDLLALHLDLGGLDIYSHFGNGISAENGDDLSTFLIGANLGNLFPLYIKEGFGLLLPLTITTDFLRVSRDRARSEFQQSSLQAAAGIQVVIGGAGGWSSGRNRAGGGLFSPVLRIKGEPFFGFSYSQGSLFGGNLRGIRGEAAVTGLRISSGFSLRAGYRYHYRAYDIDGVLYDYGMKGHTVLLGVEF